MNASVLHDVPILGHYTLAARQNFNDFFAESLRDQIVAFAMLDKNNTGFLTKTELAEALRLMGKSDREIQQVVDSAPASVDFTVFKELLRPPPQSYTSNLGSLSVPNLRKAHDVPVFGALTKGTESLLTSFVSVAAAAFDAPSDTQLLETFENLDRDGDGALDKKDVADGLRAYGTQETEIKRVMDDLGDSSATFEEFKAALHKTRRGSLPPIISSVPFTRGAN